jgi:DNA-directed RNA polymerase subunit RPC12/RpoP
MKKDTRKITHIYTCFDCKKDIILVSNQLSSSPELEQSLFDNGWRKAKSYLWKCPECWTRREEDHIIMVTTDWLARENAPITELEKYKCN